MMRDKKMELWHPLWRSVYSSSLVGNLQMVNQTPADHLSSIPNRLLRGYIKTFSPISP